MASVDCMARQALARPVLQLDVSSFFGSLFLDCCWTSARLQHHSLPNNGRALSVYMRRRLLDATLLLHIKTFITVIYIILIYIILTSIVMMTIHVIWNIHALFCSLIYDAFYLWLCLTVLSLDKVIIYEVTLNQVFADNLTIFKHHIILAYFTRTIYYLFFLT
jgi:hypothetical protein